MKTLEFDFDNVGGITRLYAVQTSALRRLDTNPLTGLSRLSLYPDAEVVEIPVYNNVLFSEVQSEEDGGSVFAVQITGFIPRQENVLLISTLERSDWLVVHQDANGDILLSGTTDIPLMFASNKTTGSDGERNGNNFTFSASLPTPSVHIDNRAFYI